MSLNLRRSQIGPPMSALGQKQTSQNVGPMSALPPKAFGCPLCANSGHRAASFDHLVGGGEDLVRHFESQRFGGS
jgi:hypothetical protein